MEGANPSFGEFSIAKSVPHYAELLEAANEAITHFSVGIAYNDKLCGSGTLVDAFGSLGILTAHHVVEATLLSRTEGDFALIIKSGPHRFVIDPRWIDCISVGIPANEGDHPDLTFLRLNNPNVLSTLKSLKSFYRISGKSFDPYRMLPLSKVPWFVSGAPETLSTPMTSTTEEGALRATILIAEATFENLIQDPAGEVLEVSLSISPSPFTHDYRGVSGGGVWIAPLCSEGPDAPSETITIEACHLAGVAFAQSELDDRMKILANGPRTLAKLEDKVKAV